MTKTTIYSAENSNRSMLFHLREVIQDFPKSHELGLRLFKRNIKAMYRQSVLGFAWALIPPVLTAVLWIFLKNHSVMSIGETGISYPVFVFTGTLLWQTFSEAVFSPVHSVNDNKRMLSKINIPKEGLLLSGVYELMFNFLIKLGLIVLMLVFFKQEVSTTGLLMAPVGILAIMIAGYSIGLIMAPVAMLFTDIQRALGLALPLLMYLTPIIYPTPKAGMVSTLMKLNPMASLIPQTRNWLTAQPTHDMAFFWIYTAAFLVLFFIGIIIYRISMPMIVERIGS